MDHCRGMEPVDSSKPVLVPGDPERLNMKKSEANHGISYHINQVKFAVSIFGVTAYNFYLYTSNKSWNYFIFKGKLGKRAKHRTAKISSNKQPLNILMNIILFHFNNNNNKKINYLFVSFCFYFLLVDK